MRVFFLFLIVLVLIPSILTYLFSERMFYPFSYLVMVTHSVGVFMFLVFTKQYLTARKYVSHLLIPKRKRRVVAVIPTYNEDPEMVIETALSVELAVKDYGDVFILDDSSNEKIRKKLDELCKKSGIRVFRRNSRRGYKAGAINDFLKVYGDRYELIAIFDADQRPATSFFDETLRYFDDPKVALVQVPQNYTEIESGIAEGALIQQIPFWRLVMRGRKNSAFSLGSGSIFRIDALKEVGLLEESTVTEDVATTVKLHEKGYKSVYLDKPLVWYGEPPKDLKSYLSQQNRWAFGYFQLTSKLLKAKLSLNQAVDYFNGWLYWLKVGLLTVVEFTAPIVFLLLGVPFIKLNPLLYIYAYMPYVISSMSWYFYLAKKRLYGIVGVFKHNTIQILAYPAVLSAFVSWILRKKKAFSVTPKKAKYGVNVLVVIPYVIPLVLLVASVVFGVFRLINPTYDKLWFATLVNVFWAMYFIPHLAYCFVLISREYKDETLDRILRQSVTA